MLYMPRAQGPRHTDTITEKKREDKDSNVWPISGPAEEVWQGHT